MLKENFEKLQYCLDKGVDYFTLLKLPKYDRFSQSWVVFNEAGVRHSFDTEKEAEEFYDSNMPEELK